MTWKDVALRLVEKIDDDICLGEIFDEMSYLLDDEEVCRDCKECLIRYMKKGGKINE